MDIPTTVRAANGGTFSASIREVRYFGGAREFEACIHYESLVGPAEAWIRVSQLQPQLDWVAMASTTLQNV